MTSRNLAVEDRTTDWTILTLLLDPEEHMPVSAEELALEIGDQVRVIHSLRRLEGAGLIHLCNGFAFPTRSARRFEELRG